jgi:hypothetical protein
MPNDWSRAEVEATVTDYLSMLEVELRGARYSKTAHRTALLSLLENRSAAAVERKHMNISAVLRDCGHPFIDGYKPYGNYQQLLAEVVADRLALDRPLLELVEREVSLPASAPAVGSLLDIWESPPESEPLETTKVGEPKATPYRHSAGSHRDYLALEASNRSLGLAGEALVMQFEAQRLRGEGAGRLADRIEHVSVARGDGLGFDILSFDADGRERLIEVKTTAFGRRTPFYITRSELECSKARPKEYHLYRLHSFRRSPGLFGLRGPVDDTCRLTANQFVARVA